MQAYPRGYFLGGSALTIAATQLAMVRAAGAQSGDGATFAPIRQVNAGVLTIGYAEHGPASGPAIVLLHGWPYDIQSFADVTPLLAAAGYRVIVPYLRGYGTTRFLSDATFRNAQQSAVAVDIIALMDALKIPQAIVAGFDWGARTADIMAVLWPERCKAIVSVSGYLITSLTAWGPDGPPLPPAVEHGWWYQYYFATERGAHGYAENTRDFNKLVWQLVSPNWNFGDATYARTAASFANPDHVAIVIHNYRWRISLAQGETKYDALEQKLAQLPAVAVPAITIASDFDGTAQSGAGYRGKFTGKYEHRVLKGIGHNVPQEAPQAFAKAVLDVAAFGV